MRQQVLRTIVACAAGLAIGAQAQTSSSSGGASTDPSSSSSSSSQSTSPSSSSGSSGAYGSSSSQSGWSGRHLSATGRMGHEAVRGSQLTGAQVMSSSGSEIGTISDTIINPGSGRLEFAVLSLGSNLGSTSSSSTSSTSTSPSSGIGTASTSGKQVAVPWMLLRSSSVGASSSASSTTSTSSTSSQAPSFTFAGDVSKLQSAPNFDASTDLNQPGWRQSVFSYFGLPGGSSATGAAETPGGTSSGSTTPQSSSEKP